MRPNHVARGETRVVASARQQTEGTQQIDYSQAEQQLPLRDPGGQNVSSYRWCVVVAGMIFAESHRMLHCFEVR